jgi:hypothetical protein
MRTAIVALLFLATLAFGRGLSRNLRLNDPRPAGVPIDGAMAAFHKLIAIAALILVAVTIRNLYRGQEFTSVELTAVVFTGLFFLLVIISGSVLSLGRARSDGLLAVHKVVSVLRLVPTFGAIYLLARGKVYSGIRPHGWSNSEQFFSARPTFVRYRLPLYFARYASSIRSLIFPSTGSNVTSFVIQAAVIRPFFCRAAA